jgi:hypothetical protein
MSAEFGISLAFLTLGSCFASYAIGKWEERQRWIEKDRRRQERSARWAEFDDEEVEP